jgi:SP family general alpha glucoside:H+ symporter-like MFS transporter
MSEHQEEKNDPQSNQVFPAKDEEHQNVVTADDVLKGAQHATDLEHNMGIMEGFRKYPKACFFSLVFSAALIMEGFDKAFITNFFAFPAFIQHYGTLGADGKYFLPADQTAGVINGVSVGQIIGLFINGYVAEWFGYRKVMASCLVLMCCFVFIQFFATSIWMYLGAGILLGIPWGVFQTITTTYAAEVCPNVLRPYLTSLVSMCWSIGYLIGTSVFTGFLNVQGEWAYRIPFALQWALPPFLLVGIFFAPESPWWLARKGRTIDAEKSLRQLRSAKYANDQEIQDTLSMMMYTVKLEQDMKTSSSYADLFKGVNLRRTEITVLTYVLQELLVPLVSYISFFLQSSGLPTSTSFAFSDGQYGLAIVGVVIAWFLVPKFGRRTLVLTGATFVALTTILIGFLGLVDAKTHPNLGYGIGSMLLIQYFVFFFTCGPVIYTIVTEIPADHLRTKSVALARATYNINVIIYSQLVPRTIPATAWNWGAKSGFLFGGIMLLGVAYAFFRLPETKNRTFAEIDIMFKNKVKARDFIKTKVDLANQTVTTAGREEI